MGTKLVKLGDVAVINPRLRLEKNEVARKIPMEALTPFQKKIDSYSFEKYSGGVKFQNGDTLVARITPSLENGKTSYVDILESNEVAFGSTEFIVLRADKNVLDEEYLYYIATSDDFRQVAIQSMTGTSGRQRVQNEAVSSYEFKLPPLDVQKQVVFFLNSIDAKIALNLQINDNLLKVCRLQFDKFKQACSATTELSNIATLIMGQSPKGDTYNQNGEGTPLLNGAADFRGGINPSKYTSDPKKVTEPGDYVFGVRATIGLTTKVFNRYAIGRGTGLARALSYKSDELLYFIMEDAFSYFARASTGSVYLNISRREFETYAAPDFSNITIKKFHEFASPLMQQIYQNQKQNEELTQLRELLLPRLLAGDIDLSNIETVMNNA
ncbi:type I restriction-modification system specificity subunit S [Ligilactobacillus salitolerans]|uniref:Type I restriction-modification system specificity subunit S n=1 Tax=Ligilactobacillus salitolerans TaxID=1808352 RepID=A0A401ITK4_9LACO|nr:restriction endonuclease subunit S [Ligilactobacillus salitolerans]GBG94846.1 type I restriction-modification system specificity subunit S [Ligilactobacillus salitolerans]